MIKTVEAVIDEQGNVRLLEPIHPRTARRALVTILEESPAEKGSEPALLSETVPTAAHAMLARTPDSLILVNKVL